MIVWHICHIYTNMSGCLITPVGTQVCSWCSGSFKANRNPGGKQPAMRDTKWAGQVQKLVMEDGTPKELLWYWRSEASIQKPWYWLTWESYWVSTTTLRTRRVSLITSLRSKTIKWYFYRNFIVSSMELNVHTLYNVHSSHRGQLFQLPWTQFSKKPSGLTYNGQETRSTCFLTWREVCLGKIWKHKWRTLKRSIIDKSNGKTD